MSKSYLVVGAGFRGFCDALELLKVPGNSVHIVEAAPFFGGVMYSLEQKGFFVDKGVHVFDSVPKALAEIVGEIMDGRVRPIEFVSASVFNGKVTEQFSLPDLASLDRETKSKITMDLVQLAAAEPLKGTPGNLGELLRRRYGATAGRIFSDIFARVYSVDADRTEASAIALTSLGRLKFLEDAEMMVLKTNPRLDAVLAARRKSVGKVDDLVSVYPDAGDAMRGWCNRAAKWLQAKGARISLGEKILSIQENANGVSVRTDKQTIEADKVLWANDNLTALGTALDIKAPPENLISGTPMIFVTLMTQAAKIKNFTYLQNFDPHAKGYRTAAAGIFSGQITPDGTSFITGECPTLVGSADWNDPNEVVKKVWQEAKDYGIVAPDATLQDSVALRLPTTFKIPLCGYLSHVAEFSQAIGKRSRRTILRDVVPFFRRDIYLDSLKVRELVEN